MCFRILRKLHATKPYMHVAKRETWANVQATKDAHATATETLTVASTVQSTFSFPHATTHVHRACPSTLPVQLLHYLEYPGQGRNLPTHRQNALWFSTVCRQALGRPFPLPTS